MAAFISDLANIHVVTCENVRVKTLGIRPSGDNPEKKECSLHVLGNNAIEINAVIPTTANRIYSMVLKNGRFNLN